MALGYSIAYVLLVVLAFLLLIYASPTRYQVKVTRRVPAPPERVWSFVSEPARFASWFPHVVESRHAGGPERGLGQLRHVVLERKGRGGEREEEATRWEESRRIDLTHRWEKRGGRDVLWNEARSEFHLAPESEGTAVTGVFWFSGRGSLGRVFSLLSIRKRHEKEFRAALEQLERRLAEETSPPPAGAEEPSARPAGAGSASALPG